MLLTFDAYTKQVQAAIEMAKFGQAGLFFTKPSPAQLRDFCRNVYEELNCSKDRYVFETFFELDTSRPATIQFDRFDVAKLRPVQKFILGKTNRPNPQVVELLAVLCAYPNRPFSVFRKEGDVAVENSSLSSENLVKGTSYNTFFNELEEEQEQSTIQVPFLEVKNRKKQIFISVCIFSFFIGGLVFLFKHNKQLDCMQ